MHKNVQTDIPTSYMVLNYSYIANLFMQ